MYSNRRALHQPFFPSPTSPNPPSPPFPKYPFSSNPSPPFFPEYPSPPPPFSSSAADPTIPANISSLTHPNPSSSHSAPHAHPKLLLSVLFSLIALSLLILSLSFLFHRRRRRSPTSSKHGPAKPLVPPPATSPAPPPPPPAASAAFLYLGTVVDSRPIQGQTANASDSPPSPYRKPGSPELRPLPPLSRNLKPNYGNATDSDDEFYSPKGSENGATATGSNSRRIFEAVADKCGFRSSDLSSPSYPDSNSSGSGSLSPIVSIPTKDSRSAAPPPPPPPPMRPMTPSPPKRKPPSPSPPLSPVVKGSGASVRSPARFNQSEGNSRNQAPAAAAAPPPPPPPPPPVGYWERQVRKRPAVTTPKSVALKGPPVDFMEDSDSLEKNDETPRPKLKPLHWDKVRASSDRAMVWDQLKSSSFK